MLPIPPVPPVRPTDSVSARDDPGKGPLISMICSIFGLASALIIVVGARTFPQSFLTHRSGPTGLVLVLALLTVIASFVGVASGCISLARIRRNQLIFPEGGTPGRGTAWTAITLGLLPFAMCLLGLFPFV